MKTITYDMALAAAQDKATAQMKKDGRTTWNRSDYLLAVETLNKLYKIGGDERNGRIYQGTQQAHPEGRGHRK